MKTETDTEQFTISTPEQPKTPLQESIDEILEYQKENKQEEKQSFNTSNEEIFNAICDLLVNAAPAWEYVDTNFAKICLEKRNIDKITVYFDCMFGIVGSGVRIRDKTGDIVFDLKFKRGSKEYNKAQQAIQKSIDSRKMNICSELRGVT
jgi:hypothetical protein